MREAKVRLGFALDDVEGNEYPFVQIDDNNPRHATLISQPHLVPGLSAGDVLLLKDTVPELTKALARNEEGEVVEAGTMPLYEVEAIISKCGRTSLCIIPTDEARSDPDLAHAFQSEVRQAAKALYLDAPEHYTLSWQMGYFVLTTDPGHTGYARVLASMKMFDRIETVAECEVMDLGEREGNEGLGITPFPYVKPH